MISAKNKKHIETIITESRNDHFNFFDFAKNNKKKILLIVLASILFSFSTTSLLTRAATIPTGVSAISLTFSFIFTTLKPYLNFISLGLNIPLFLIFWKKIKKSYCYLTLLFLILSAIFGFLIAFDWTGSGESSLDYYISNYLFVFCPPTNNIESLYAKEHGLNNLAIVRIDDFYKWCETNKDINNSINSSNFVFDRTGITIGVSKGWPIFVYCLAGVILSASAGAIAWKCGSSTGGTDIIAYYYSTKQKKSVGNILMLIGAAISVCSLFIVWSLGNWAPLSVSENINGFKSLLGLQSLSSAIYVVLYGKILNIIYPKYAKVVVKIDTVNVDLIKEYFEKSNFHHAFKIHTLTSGRTGKNIYTFETVVLLLEVEELIRNIKNVDPSAWISRSKIQKVYGDFDYSKVE